MKKYNELLIALMFIIASLCPIVLTGCAAALIGAGAVGGYAVAKNLDSSNPPPEKSGNKGWFGGK